MLKQGKKLTKNVSVRLVFGRQTVIYKYTKKFVALY